MAVQYSIATAFKAVDKVSGAFKKMGVSAGLFGKKGSRAFGRVNKSASMLGSIIKGNLISGAISKGFGLIASGVRGVIDEFVDFDNAITSASAKFKNLTGQQLKDLAVTAREVGASTKFSAAEAAQGLDFLAMAGFSADQAMKVLAPTASLATVANVDLARSTDIASDSLGAFGLMTKDSVKLEKNFIEMNDSLAATMTATNTGIEDMFEAIKKGAPAFTAAGQGMNTFNSLVGTLANSGIKGAEAGTALRNVMLRLAKPTGEAADIMDSLGIQTQDSKGNFRDVVDILGQFEEATKKMGTAQKTAALSTIFGARTVTGINVLLKAGTKDIKSFRNELDNSGGAAERMADIMNNSLGNRLKALRSAAIEVGFKFLDAFKGDATDGITAITEALRTVNVEPLINMIKTVLELIKPFASKIIEVFGPLFGQLLDVIVPIIEEIKQPFFEILEFIQPLVDAFMPLVNLLSKLLAPAFRLIAGLIKFLVPVITLLVDTLTVLLEPVVDLINWVIDGLASVFSFFGGLFGSGETKIIEKRDITNTNDVTAPNEAIEQSKRDAFGGNANINVTAANGASIESVDDNLVGVDLKAVGAN
jgi:TP901 family phage tail tape measure protein